MTAGCAAAFSLAFSFGAPVSAVATLGKAAWDKTTVGKAETAVGTVTGTEVVFTAWALLDPAVGDGFEEEGALLPGVIAKLCDGVLSPETVAEAATLSRTGGNSDEDFFMFAMPVGPALCTENVFPFRLFLS